MDPFNASLNRLASPPCVDSAAVEITFVHGIDRAKNNVVHGVKRVGGFDLIGCHQLGGRTRRMLYRLVRAQSVGKAFVRRKIHVAKRLNAQFWNTLITAHPVPEGMDEVSGELADTHVQLS